MERVNGKPIIVKKQEKQVNMEKVIRTIEKLENNENWLAYIEAVAEELDILIEETRKELIKEKGKESQTASLKYTGVIGNINEKIQEFIGIIFNKEEIVELLKVINHFLKEFGLNVHPLPNKGLFVSRLNGNEKKSDLVDRIEMRFREKLRQR